MSVLRWHRFGRGSQATIKRPYHDLEVLPMGVDRWQWRAHRMDASNGCFELVGAGLADDVESARASAFDAVVRSVDWFGLIRRALQTHWLETSQLNQALQRNKSPQLGAMSHLDAYHCLDWLENHRGLESVRAMIREPM